MGIKVSGPGRDGLVKMLRSLFADPVFVVKSQFFTRECHGPRQPSHRDPGFGTRGQRPLCLVTITVGSKMELQPERLWGEDAQKPRGRRHANGRDQRLRRPHTRGLL